MKWHPGVGSLAVAGALAVSFIWVNAQQGSGGAVAIDAVISAAWESAKGSRQACGCSGKTDLPTSSPGYGTDDQGSNVLRIAAATNSCSCGAGGGSRASQRNMGSARSQSGHRA